eukprot:m.98789 g.98789  ORF g.98789 m.98789 type:complete len:147 (+) comp16760_c0_seq3:176-616(+)
MRQNRFVCRLHAYNALTVSLTTIASGDRYVYKNAAARVLRMDTMLKSMQTVKWDCKDLPEQHNPYIDALRKELEVGTVPRAFCFLSTIYPLLQREQKFAPVPRSTQHRTPELLSQCFFASLCSVDFLTLDERVIAYDTLNPSMSTS